MFTNLTSLTDRFTWLLDELCKVIGADAHKRRMEAALAWAVWNRVRLLLERLIALIVRARSGRLAAATGKRPHPGPPPQAREREDGGAVACAASLPQEFGWVTRVLPATTQFAGVLAYLLRDAEVAALVEKAPQAGSILRPLCRLLGVQAPEFLRRRGGAGASFAPQLANVPPQGAEGNDCGDVSAGAPPPPRPSPLEGEGEMASPEPVRPPRPLSWLEQDAQAMRERVARWVAGHADAPNRLLPLGLSPTLAFPDTNPIGFVSKNRG